MCGREPTCVGLVHNKYEECYLKKDNDGISNDDPVHQTNGCMKTGNPSPPPPKPSPPPSPPSPPPPPPPPPPSPIYGKWPIQAVFPGYTTCSNLTSLLNTSVLSLACGTYYEYVQANGTYTHVRLCSFDGMSDQKGPKKCLNKATRGQCEGTGSKAKKTQTICERTCEFYLYNGGVDNLPGACAAGDTFVIDNAEPAFQPTCYDSASAHEGKDSGYCSRKAGQSKCSVKSISDRCLYTCNDC